MGISKLNELKFQEKLKLAASYESLDNYLHAIQIYTSLINEDSSYIDSYISYASLYERMGKIPEALKIIDKLIKSNPGNDYALLFAAEFNLHYSYWNETVEIISNLDSKEFPVVDYWFGLCYYNLKEFYSAREYLEKFCKQNPDVDQSPEATLLLAKIEFELNNYKVALKYAEKIQYYDPDNWELNLIMTKIFYKLDMYSHAAQQADKALNNKKNNPEIIETAAIIYFKSGDIKKAEKFFKLLLETSDNISAEVYFYFGAIETLHKRFDKARNYLELALKIEPDFRPAIEALQKLNLN